MKRREFLGKSLAAAGALAVGANLSCTQKRKQSIFYDPYETVPLGRTGLKVSRLCLGTGMRGWMRESNQTRLGKEKFESLIKDAYDQGVRLFDLADLYGSHHFVAGALKGIPRKRYTINTKIWWRPNGIPEKERPDSDIVVNRFLKELNTDYIDIVLLHCVDSPDWPTVLSDQMQILDNLKKKGVIRAHGVSCHSLPALKSAAAESWVDSVNARINPYGVKMDGPAEEVVPVLKSLHTSGKGVIGMKIIGEGQFRTDEEKKNASIQFVLDIACVDVLNVGFENIQEIDDFASRVQKVRRA